MKTVQVKQDPESPVPTEVLADAIVAISEGVRRLRAGRLTDHALFLLVQHAAPTSRKRGSYGKRIPLGTIKLVFEAIEHLETQFVKRKPVSR
jgi:hypothetical protein